MTVYVLVATAVYDHGVVGVYETRDQAKAAAEEIWPTTDGHHCFRIDERVLGEIYPDAFERTYWSHRPLADGSARFVLDEPS